MADYIYINQYDRGGELAIHRNVFARITEAAVSHTSLKSSLNVKGPVKVIFKKDGKVTVDVHVSIKKGVKPTLACEELQKEIARDLEVYVESIPFEVEISVDEIK